LSEPFVRPDVRIFLDYLNNLPGPRSQEVGPVEARILMQKSRHVADAPAGELALIRNLAAPGPVGDVPLRLYDAREERGPGPVLVFFHGGGFVMGDLETHEPFCAHLARELDLPVVAVDYRLAPEHPWPAGVEDAIAAARWTAGSPEALARPSPSSLP
jgi:acetyl esterase